MKYSLFWLNLHHHSTNYAFHYRKTKDNHLTKSFKRAGRIYLWPGTSRGPWYCSPPKWKYFYQNLADDIFVWSAFCTHQRTCSFWKDQWFSCLDWSKIKYRVWIYAHLYRITQIMCYFWSLWSHPTIQWIQYPIHIEKWTRCILSWFQRALKNKLGEANYIYASPNCKNLFSSQPPSYHCAYNANKQGVDNYVNEHGI